MFCTNCGKQIPDGAQFCTSCGTKATAMEEAGAATVPLTGSPQASGPSASSRADEASRGNAEVAYTPKYPVGKPAPQQVPQHTKAMPQVARPQMAAAAAGAQRAYAQSAPVDSSLRTKKIILGVLVAVIAVLIVAIIGMFSCSRKAIAIDSTNFPNERIREAVTVALDINGDGILSPEEADAATGIKFVSGGVEFITADSGNANGNASGGTAGNNSGNGSGNADGRGAGDSGSYPDVGDDDGASSNEESVPGIDEAVDDFFRYFPNLTMFICHDGGLTRMDLGKVKKLEYLDCTGTSVKSLDLSKNKSIVSMFCDDEVSLTGMDSAGLYYRDLITSVADSSSSNSGGVDTKFEYDGMGRVTSGAGKTFTYDEDGRLIRAQAGTDEYAWYEEYRYNTDGLLAEASVFQPLEASAQPFEYVFEYDDKKKLKAFSQEIYGNNVYSGTIEYSGDKITAMKTSDGDAGDRDSTWKMTTDNAGRITQVERSALGQYAYEGTYSFGYLSNGQCSNFDSNLKQGSSSTVFKDSFATRFSSADAPTAFTVSKEVSSSSNWAYDVTFETNDDGYITKIVTPSNSASPLSGTSISVSYVKHVGKLEDIPSQRYVPVFRAENSVSMIGDMTWHLSSDLYANTGSSTNLSILEDAPLQVTFQAMGLAPNLVSNPNEQKLADYLAEHWDAPFELKGTATASSKSASSSAKPSSSASANSDANANSGASNDSARVVNTEYFTFTMPESWVGKVEMERIDYTDSDGENHYYYFKPAGSSKQGCDVICITVTDDPMAQFGEVAVVGEFKINDRFTGYVDYGNNGIYSGYCPADLASKILSLQSGGQITSPGQQQADSKIIEAWLKANVVPNIKAK